MDTLHDTRLTDVLLGGALGVIPTDTTYGLVCRAADKDAVERLYRTKARESKPGTIVAASIEQLVELGIPRRYLTAVEQFWPNPISVIVPTEPSLGYLDRGLMSVAVRIPANTSLRELLQHTGALLTTSANQPGEPVATTIDEARVYFGEKIDFYVDGGLIAQSPPSTIIRVIDDEIEVVRQGAILINDQGEIVS